MGVIVITEAATVQVFRFPPGKSTLMRLVFSNLPQRFWGGAPVESEFCVFSLKI